MRLVIGNGNKRTEVALPSDTELKAMTPDNQVKATEQLCNILKVRDRVQAGSLNDGVPNRTDHRNREFQPK